MKGSFFLMRFGLCPLEAVNKEEQKKDLVHNEY